MHLKYYLNGYGSSRIPPWTSLFTRMMPLDAYKVAVENWLTWCALNVLKKARENRTTFGDITGAFLHQMDWPKSLSVGKLMLISVAKIEMEW